MLCLYKVFIGRLVCVEEERERDAIAGGNVIHCHIILADKVRDMNNG